MNGHCWLCATECARFDLKSMATGRFQRFGGKVLTTLAIPTVVFREIRLLVNASSSPEILLNGAVARIPVPSL